MFPFLQYTFVLLCDKAYTTYICLYMCVCICITEDTQTNTDKLTDRHTTQIHKVKKEEIKTKTNRYINKRQIKIKIDK